MKKSMVLFLTAAMVLGLTACGGEKAADSKAPDTETTKTQTSDQDTAGSGGKEEAKDGKIVIGMAMNEEIDFINELQTALENYAKSDENIEIIFTNANSNAEKQLSDVDSLIAQSPDVIVLRVVDADAGAACVEAVKNAGIPCVVQDTAVNSDLYDCRIVGDQSTVGKLIGGYMQEWLDADESRQISMGYINGAPSEVIKKRETGIYEAVDQNRVHTFASQISTGFSAEGAMTFAEDWLQSQPDMNCIACANDEMAAACIQALNAAGVNFDEFLVFGCDGGTIGQQYLKSGELKATVYQSVDKIAQAIIDVSKGITAGETYENKIYDPDCYKLMTKDNMEELLKEN
ncbi:sugar ABC transporter substrate-binding protein [Diplocloster hominis]|uniref:sugar ABC transporter substrate-binding protein n=1 Tax=Diplocloster hominis TaxID=3079010 RepID=UPI0031BB663A